jgi:NADH dehydrogenase
MATKNVVVVGAGYSGVFTARKLAKQLKGTDYQIVLVDRHSFFTYMTELHEVATKRVEPKHIQFDLGTLFNKMDNVKIVTADVESIDKDAKLVKTSEGDISYEKLVLATGGTTNTFGTPGVEEFGYTLWSFEEAVRLREHIETVIREGAMELDPAKREAKLRIVVVGSGFTGVELAGELIEYRKELAEANDLEESEIKLDVVEAAPTILNMLTDRKLADKGEQYMIKHGINLMKATGVVGVEESAAVLKDGTKIPTETLVWTAGVKAKDQGAQWGLEQGPGGRFLADEYSRANGEADIYVAGDVAAYREPVLIVEDNLRSGWTPQTVEGGESAANTVVPNIVFELTGNGERKPFKGHYQGYAVSIGAHYTVGIAQQLGNFKLGENGIALSGFFANMFKHIINIYFFLQIMSGYHIFHYLLDEFFRTPNGRTPFYGMTSRLGNVLWSLPLRLIVGFIWMIVGGQFGGTAGVIALLIGWFILFGLFTSAASFVGFIFGMVLAFHTTAFSPASLLLPFASLALMNGAGRTLGLDFWVVPFLEKTLGEQLYGTHRSRYNDLKK